MAKKMLGRSLANQHNKTLLLNINKVDKYSKNRRTFRLSTEAKRQMAIRVAEDSYGLRGKSKWVTDTLYEFLNPDTWKLNGLNQEEPVQSWKRIVIDTELLKEQLVVDAVNLEEDVRVLLWRSAIDAAIYGSEMQEPVYLDISSASVIRAAVMWKLAEKRGAVLATVANK